MTKTEIDRLLPEKKGFCGFSNWQEGHTDGFNNALTLTASKLAGQVATEDEVGFLLFFSWNKFSYEVAKEYWTARHEKLPTKTVCIKLARALQDKFIILKKGGKG